MSLILIEEKQSNISSDNKKHNYAAHLKFIFNKAYGNNFSKVYELERIQNKKINKDDFVLITFLPDLKTLKFIKNFIKEKNAFLGMIFGDSVQYIDAIYSYYANFIDFCFTEEFSDAYMYESFCGLAAFHHPMTVVRQTDYYKKSINQNISNQRPYDFIHVGRFDNERPGRMNIKTALLKSKSKYLLIGPSKGCEFLENKEVYNKLRNANFGLVSCACPSTTPLSTIKINNQFNFKGKIWEYILAGCIPVLDYVPNAYKFGLKEGIHYIRLNNFTKSNLEKLLLINEKEIRIMRNSLFSLAEKECSPNSLKKAFDEFQNSSMLHAPKKLIKRFEKEIMLNACHDYSIKRKRLSFSIIFSGFYFFKVLNRVHGFFIS